MSDNMGDIKLGTLTVSYTHLDVYKRQRLMFYSRIPFAVEDTNGSNHPASGGRTLLDCRLRGMACCESFDATALRFLCLEGME